jgi:hypothetical protein
MLNGTVRDVNDMVRVELEQPDLGRARAAADGESRAMSKTGRLPGNDCYYRQAMRARQFGKRVARGGRDSGLAEPRASRARGTMWACGDCAAPPHVSRRRHDAV